MTAAGADGGGRALEVQRQRALVAAIRGGAIESSAQVRGIGAATREAGLAAYRGNAALLADRALALAFPTLRAMVGAEAFAHLARSFGRASPPHCGDLGEWGEDFAAVVRSDSRLADWPCLADCARLDWAVHRCERAADSAFDAASMARLESVEPSRLRLRLRPGTQVLESAWPIATIHAAHRTASADVDAIREALAAERAECVLVWRCGWRGCVQAIDRATFDFTSALLEGIDLWTALSGAPSGFAFEAWLADALRASWLRDVALTADDSGPGDPAEP